MDNIIHQFQHATVDVSLLQNMDDERRCPFHAILDFTDNSKDAGAKNVWVDFVDKNNTQTIEILDDGSGMSPEEVKKIKTFGYSSRREDSSSIGHYGNGLKAGGMKLGSDILLLTKKDEKFSAMLISIKFHEDHEIYDRILIPIVSFDSNFRALDENRDVHEAMRKMIEKYGLRGKMEKLEEQFERIRGPSGTLIVIGSLKGNLKTNVPDDFRMTGSEDSWIQSLRNYLSTIYQDNPMRIFLCGEEIVQKWLPEHWLFPKVVSLKTLFKEEENTRFLECKEDVKEAKKALKKAERKLRKFKDPCIDREARKEKEQAEIDVENAKKHLATVQQSLEEAAEKNPPKIIPGEIYVGVNVVQRNQYGLFFYVNNRLIVGCSKDSKFYDEKTTLGISAIVFLTTDILEPTPDKQDFTMQDGFYMLKQTMTNWLQIYKAELDVLIAKKLDQQFNIRFGGQNGWNPRLEKIWEGFWNQYGYQKAFDVDCPQVWLSFQHRETFFNECWHWTQCNNCRFWRRTKSQYNPATFQCHHCVEKSDEVKWELLARPVKQKEPVVPTSPCFPPLKKKPVTKGTKKDPVVGEAKRELARLDKFSMLGCTKDDFTTYDQLEKEVAKENETTERDEEIQKAPENNEDDDDVICLD